MENPIKGITKRGGKYRDYDLRQPTYKLLKKIFELELYDCISKAEQEYVPVVVTKK